MTNTFERFQAAIRQSGADAVVLTPGSTLRYVTGFPFHASERLTLLIVPRERRPSAVLPNFEESNWRENVQFDTALHLWDDTAGPSKAVAAAMQSSTGIAQCAVERGVMRVFELEHLRAHLPNAAFPDAEPIAMALRAHKQPHEIASMKRAIEIAETALDELLQHVEVGAQERALAARLSALLLEGGGEGISFGPIVLSGPNSALPHGVPGERKIEAGDFLLIDFGTSHNGYHCDITRTFFVGGEPSQLARQLYEAVREGNARGCAACGPGVTADAVHHAAQDGLHGPQFEGFFRHRTGHGLGLDVHEPPSVMDGNAVKLAPGNVFTVEPGLYKAGFGGVRIEDDVLITESGVEVLTTYPRELRVL